MYDFHTLSDPVYAPVQQPTPAPVAPVAAPQPQQRMIGDYVSALQPQSTSSDGTPGYLTRPNIVGPGADMFNNLWSTMYGNMGTIGAPPYSGGGGSFSMTNPSQQNSSLGQNF